MQTQLVVNLSYVLSPAYYQSVWGVGYTEVKLQANEPLKNGNPTAYVNEYDSTLREQTLPLNIMDVCKAAFSWVSEVPGDSGYFPSDHSTVVSLSNYPFAKDQWVNASATKTIYPTLCAVKGKVFVPQKTKGVEKLVKAQGKYLYLLDYFDKTVLELVKNPNDFQGLRSMFSTSTELFREAVYNVPPQGLWGDCYCMAPMGASHISLALQKASEVVTEGESDTVKRYFWAMEAQKYATVNRFSSTAMRTCYQEYAGKPLGTSVLQAGGDTSQTMVAIKLHGVAPYSYVTQPLILNDANSFVDFALHNNWNDLQHRTQLELAEFYAKFTSLKAISPALAFGRQYCDLEQLRMINFASNSENIDMPAGISHKTRQLLAENGLPGFGNFPQPYQSGDAPIPNSAAIELIKSLLGRGVPICCGGAISRFWSQKSQKYGCVPPAAIDDESSYAGGHETFIVGMCERDDADQDIKALFEYWQDRAAQVEDENVQGLSGLSQERQQVYKKEKYLLFIMNHWNYWGNSKLFTQGPSGLEWLPKSQAKLETPTIWLNEEKNEEEFYQLGTSPVLGATPEQRVQIPSHVYILPGSYLFYLSNLTILLNPTYLSADYEEKSLAKTEVNATDALLKYMGVDNINADEVKSISIQIDPDNYQ